MSKNDDKIVKSECDLVGWAIHISALFYHKPLIFIFLGQSVSNYHKLTNKKKSKWIIVV